MLQAYAVNVDGEISSEVWNILVNSVSLDRQMKINKYLFLKDKMASVFADRLLFHYMNVVNQCVDYHIQVDKFGKPFFQEKRGIHFNISHSGDWVVCAFGEAELGIDIQKVKDVDLGIAEHFFHSIEYETLRQCENPEDAKEHFCRLWTLKESYVKWTGVGLSGLSTSLYFDITKKEIICYQDNKRVDGVFYTTKFMNDYFLTICHDQLEEFSPNRNLHIVSRQELIQETLQMVT